VGQPEKESLAVMKERLHAEGKRVTQQRLLVFQAIQERGTHLTADEIYLQARKNDANINLSTVYRTLGLLKELGLVKELHFDGGQHYYEPRGEGEPHHHLICSQCGKIVEFQCPFCNEIQEEVAEEHGFIITGTHIDLIGYCPLCQERRENKLSLGSAKTKDSKME